MKCIIKPAAYLLLLLFFIPVGIGLVLYYTSKIIRALSHLFLFDADCFAAELSDWDIQTSLKEK